MMLTSKVGLAVPLLVLSFVLPTHGQTSDSICALQDKVAQGQRVTVRVSGVYSSGFEEGVLEDAACPGYGTWVELDLQSRDNRGRLKKAMNEYGGVDVVFEGEFYGPPLPDPKLPEAIRRVYHPGWGHLGAFKSKIVVKLIVEANPAYGRLMGAVSSYRSPFPLQVSIKKAQDNGVLGTQTLSDEGGFEFDRVEPGEYVVTVTNPNNCVEYRTSVRVEAGTTKKVSIGPAQRLRPNLCE